MTNKSREKVRKAHPGSEADRKTHGFLNRQWLSDNGTVVIGFKFLSIKCIIFINNYKNAR